MRSFAVATAVGLLASTASAIQPIVIKGKHFFYENGTEFFIRGVAYQQDVNSNTTTTTTADATFTDPLADETACARDIPILKELGTNTIRVYAINASLDHSACMDLLAENEIYVLQDLSNPSASIVRSDPTWTTTLYSDYAAVIDEMVAYNHTLGFFAGNEVSNAVSNTNASAYVKAAVRDMKAYIKTQNYREIGVGYATNDDAAIRTELAAYFDCAPEDATIDFWGYNIYSWCGDSSYEESGYADRTAEFKNYSVPAFFAEYGCNEVTPRLFTEVQAIYGKNMTEVWSGGIVYMYFQEANDYGLVTVVDSTSVSLLSDFTSLSAQLALATPATTAMADYTPIYTALQACPTIGDSWAAPSALPPIASIDVCECMLASLTCVAKTSLDSDTITSQFGVVCGDVSCDGITSSVIDDIQGAYSPCTPYQKLSWAYNQYYLAQDSASTACNFDGNAKTQKGSESDTCKALLSEAGSEGTGTVTSNPTSGSTATGSTTKSTSTSSSTSSSSAAVGVRVAVFDWGFLAMGVYLLAAGFVGAGALLM